MDRSSLSSLLAFFSVFFLASTGIASFSKTNEKNYNIGDTELLYTFPWANFTFPTIQAYTEYIANEDFTKTWENKLIFFYNIYKSIIIQLSQLFPV